MGGGGGLGMRVLGFWIQGFLVLVPSSFIRVLGFWGFGFGFQGFSLKLLGFGLGSRGFRVPESWVLPHTPDTVVEPVTQTAESFEPQNSRNLKSQTLNPKP